MKTYFIVERYWNDDDWACPARSRCKLVTTNRDEAVRYLREHKENHELHTADKVERFQEELKEQPRSDEGK